jgi:acetyl esterase/lipase
MGFLPRPLDLLTKSVRAAGAKFCGIAYGVNARQMLDIYRPAGPPMRRPVMVFFYGGSWQTGARADYEFVARLLSAQGFVVVVADYRVHPEARFPAFVEDCLAAVNWTAAHIAEYGGDPEAVFLLGHSAGAYNAVMVGLAADAPALAGVIGLAGPYDFLPLKDPVLKAIFAGPTDIRETQPITHVHGDAPPMFLTAGGRDRTVLPRNTTALAARLRQAGAVVETKIYPKLGHISLLLALLPYLRWRAPVLRDVLEFVAAARGGEFALPRSESLAPMVRRSL